MAGSGESYESYDRARGAPQATARGELARQLRGAADFLDRVDTMASDERTPGIEDAAQRVTLAAAALAGSGSGLTAPRSAPSGVPVAVPWPAARARLVAERDGSWSLKAMARESEPVALRDDAGAPPVEGEPVDCAARLSVCHALCCRFQVLLSPDEVAAGVAGFELGRPYFLRRSASGFCAYNDRDGGGGCTIYGDRPQPCRTYSCRNDLRIWADFDAMILNEEFVSRLYRSDPTSMWVTTFDAAEDADL